MISLYQSQNQFQWIERISSAFQVEEAVNKMIVLKTYFAKQAEYKRAQAS